jgi:hypothetical protein
MSDFSFEAARIVEAIREVANEMQRPSVLYRARVARSGMKWRCHYGEISAYGDTPAEAVSNFDYYAWWGKEPPRKAPPSSEST